MTENEAQVKALVENWAQAVRNRNINQILAHHSDELIMYDVPVPFQSVGLKEYRETWELFFRYTRPGVFDIHEMHVVADENVAFCFARMRCDDRSKSQEFQPLDFRLTIGLKKIKGDWIIVHEHHSVPSD